MTIYQVTYIIFYFLVHYYLYIIGYFGISYNWVKRAEVVTSRASVRGETLDLTQEQNCSEVVRMSDSGELAGFTCFILF